MIYTKIEPIPGGAIATIYINGRTIVRNIPTTSVSTQQQMLDNFIIKLTKLGRR